MRVFSIFLGYLLVSFAAHAQSTITLDDFNIENSDENSATSAAMESCLVDSSNCKDSKLKSSTNFSIDDVVNLGIVDHSEVKVQPVNTENSASSAQTLPSIDMEILFDYNSNAIREDQIQKLSKLSEVLKKSKFDKFKFAFIGHTDARGGAESNLKLSIDRAHSVSQFLIDEFDIKSKRLVSSGMGASRLKTPHDPFGSANRRVQLVLIPVI